MLGLNVYAVGLLGVFSVGVFAPEKVVGYGFQFVFGGWSLGELVASEVFVDECVALLCRDEREVEV